MAKTIFFLVLHFLINGLIPFKLKCTLHSAKVNKNEESEE